MQLSSIRPKPVGSVFDAVSVIVAIAGAIFVASVPLKYSLAGLGLAAAVWTVILSPVSALILLLVISPLRALILTESPGSLPVDIGQLLTVVVMAAWLVRRIVERRRILPLYWSPLFLPLFLFGGIVLVTVLPAFSPAAWAVETLKWTLLPVLVYLELTMHGHRRWEWLVFGLSCAGIANALVGIYIFLGGSGALHLLVNDRFFRAFGTFGQPNPFGGFMGLLAPIAAMMAYGNCIHVWQRYRRINQIPYVAIIWATFYVLAAGLITFGVLISWSRGAWLGLAVSGLAVIFAIPHRWWHRISIVVLVMGFGLLAWSTGIIPASIEDRVSSATSELFRLDDVRAVDITTENYPIVERLAHWQAAFNMAEDNFWLGAGAGNYEVAYDSYRLTNWDESLGHAHNYYLNVFGETGIIGLLSYAASIMGILWITWQTRQHPDPIARAAAIGLFGSWIYLLTHSLTDNLFVNNLFLHIGVMLGIVAGLNREMRPVSVSGR